MYIYGEGFTGFQKRGNPAVAIQIDGKPLTGATLDKKGKFDVEMVVPPFDSGEHVIDVFGVQCTIEIKNNGEVITQEQLHAIIERDFKLTSDCHMLLSDVRYRACPEEVLRCYLGKTQVPKKKYIAEWFDCDDFSDALHGQFTYDTYPQGYAHGELWVLIEGGGGHAINCFCVKMKETGDVKMKVVEPQSGDIFDFPPHWKAFVVKI
jgi:hypothetical protein